MAIHSIEMTAAAVRQQAAAMEVQVFEVGLYRPEAEGKRPGDVVPLIRGMCKHSQ